MCRKQWGGYIVEPCGITQNIVLNNDSTSRFVDIVCKMRTQEPSYWAIQVQSITSWLFVGKHVVWRFMFHLHAIA